MANDLVKNGLHLITDSIKVYGKDYTSNLQDLKNDAESIKAAIITDAKSPIDTFKKIRSGAVFRDITGWFKQQSEDTENDDSDYDYGSSSDDENEDSPSVHSIDASSVRDISNDQTSAMYGIGAKQVEASIANTAEIITSFGDHTSKIIASVNNVNKSIMDLTKRIDVLISVSQTGINNKSIRPKEDSDRITENSGELSLMKIFEKSRSNINDNMIKTSIEMMINTLKGGTKADALSLLGHQFLDNKKIGVLGGKTINQIGTAFNDTVGSVTQSVLSELVASKKFKGIFGDMNSTVGDRDYSKLINNQYNTKPATFDGMTRYSIINVIPEYLKKINQSLSGESLQIDAHGRLTTKKTDEKVFDKVTKASFADSGLSFETTDSLVQSTKAVDVNISSKDIDAAGRALTMTYVLYLHKNGLRSLRPSQINSDDITVISTAVKTLVDASGKSDSFWTPICMTIMQRISTNLNERSAFVKNVNSRLNNMVDDAVNFATNSRYNYKASTITADMANSEFKDDYKKRNDGDTKPFEQGKDIKPEIKKVEDDSYQYTQLDYLRGIFGILDRGINVRNTGKKPYDHYDIKVSNPNKKVLTDSEKVEKDKNGNEVTVSDGKKDFLSKMIDNLIPKGIRLNMQHFANNVLKPLDTQLGVTDKNNTTGDESIMSKFKQLMSPIGDNAKQLGQIVGGVKVTDEDGKVKRQGGIVQGIGNKLKGELNNIGSDVRSAFDAKIANQDYKRFQKEVNNIRPMDDDMVQDQIKAQQVFAMMQTATTDGDTTEDIGPISNIINGIKNTDLKARLQSSISNMLKNNSSKGADKKSMMGSILAKGLFGLKTILSPISKVLKTILFSVKAVGSKVGNLIMKGIKSGMRDIKVGMSSMARGMFGQKERKDANGNVIESASDGVLGKLVRQPIQAIVKEAKSLLTTIGKVTKTLYGNMAKLVKTGVSKLGTKISESVTNIAAKIKLPKLKNPLAGDFSSNFMKGFSSVFKETQALKEKERLNSLKPATVADVKSTQIHEILTGKATSIFSKMVDIGNSILGKLIETKEEPDEPESDLEVGKSIRDKLIEPKEEPDNAESDNRDNSTNTPSVGGASQSSIASNLSSSATGTAAAAVSEDSGDGESPIASARSAPSGTASAPASGGATSKKGKLGFDLGKIAGGFTSALFGIGKIILTVVASLEGFKALTSLIEDVFKTGLKPLNGAFQAIIKAIKPIVKIVTEIVTVIAQAITQIVETLIKVIQPILEAIQPILETIFSVLKPILDMITGLIEIILAPLMGIIQAIIVPVMRHIGNSLEVLLGVVQVGMGVILAALGGILMGVGSIVKLFGGGRGILDSGKEMGSMGKGMITSGIGSVQSGIGKEIALVKEVVSGDIFKQDTKDAEETNKITPDVSQTGSTSSVMDGVVSTTTPTATTTTPAMTTTNSVTNTSTTSTMDVYNNSYGSGNSNTYNQHSYSSNNMSARGCGPVALADAYSRRSGKAIDPSVLAANMKMSGNYNPSKGTSVGGFLNTSKSMGMNTTVGGVTSKSLRKATPNNPITVMGSGSEYGTRKGNNHYVNVVGSDKAGGSYVLNPMSGRIERRSTAGIVANAKLGMYGSGDSDSESKGFQFDESTTEAIDNLKNISGSLFSMFTGKSENDKMNDAINAEKEKEATKQAKLSLGDEAYAKFEKDARNLFKKENPKRDGESDKDYEKRFQKNKDKYITRVSVDAVNKNNSDSLNGSLKKMNSAQTDSENSLTTLFNNAEKMAVNSQFQTAPTANDAMLAGATIGSNTPGGSFKSDGGVILAMPKDDTTVTKTDMTIAEGGFYSKSPIHEFFSKMMGKRAYTESGGFFGQRENQNAAGIGTSGKEHSGIDINAPNDSDGATKVIAPVDGKVTDSRTSESMGNTVWWVDSAGNTHRVMHMAQKPLVEIGDTVKGGQTLLGYVGNTGDSFGDHLHYDIIKTDHVMGPNEMEHNGDIFTNPMTYWKYNPPAAISNNGNQSKIQVTPVMDQESCWCGTYANDPGMKNFIDAARKAGLSSAQTAVIAATGIAEDSGKKLTGKKSLTEVTDDYNGQRAVGIMNWIPNNEQNGQDTSFGVTLEEQLRYMRDQYFADNAVHSKAISTDPYRSDFPWGDVYKQVTGRTNFGLKPGDRYGSYINKDIIEGMAQYTGTAVVPGGFTSEAGMANRLGTAAEAYNWMKDMGYASGDTSPFTSGDNFDIPPLAMNAGGNSSINPITINKYEMAVNEEKRTKRLKMILENTYNVRSEKIEDLLEKILNKLGGDTKKTTIKSKPSSHQESLFENNELSPSATRLYVG